MVIWIRTSEAAKMLGYNPDYFRLKYFDIFQRSGDVIRQPGGHCRWRLTAISRLINPQESHKTDMTA